MQFELTTEFLDELREHIGNNDLDKAFKVIYQLHAADIAEILDNVTLEEAKFIYSLLDAEKAADVLMELEEDVRANFLDALSANQIAKHVKNLDSDDAADLLTELTEDKKREVLGRIDDVEQKSDIVDLLTYDEYSAGGLMAKELIKVNMNWTVLRCVREMRKQAENVSSVYTVYVVDDNEVLKGILSLKKLLLTPEREIVANIIKKDVISVQATATSEEVAKFIEKYDLVVLPVVDELGRLIGRITVDDVVDVMREEAKEDYQMMSGISEDIESSDNVWVSSRARIPWLLIAMLGGIVAAQVIGLYEEQLSINPQMAYFIPLIVAMGGNVGIQSSALIVQGLANKTLHDNGMLQRILKELGVGLVNGLACAVLLMAYSLVFNYSLALSLSVSISMLSVIIFAAAFGTFMPLVLNKYKFDPALATGPFITTSNDIFGLIFYFLIARGIYGIL